MKKVLLNILTHGDELVGLKVAEIIKQRNPTIIGNGLDVQIANEEAYRRGKRCIDKDLNRVFPGDPNGSVEEKRAHELTPVVSSYDMVVDVHSTESGSGDMVIVTKLDDETKKTVKALSPKYVLYMNMPPDRSLISCARIGIAFEMGSDKDEATCEKTVEGVECLLSYRGFTTSGRSFGFASECFEVFDQVLKPANAILEPYVENFTKVYAGEVFAKKANGDPLIAEYDFYPVIFGNTNYETIFGFAARPLTLD